MSKHRNVSPLIQHLRNFLRGRKVVIQLRYADVISARTQPPPEIPGGPYHKLSQIYYFTHDARREVQPPLEIPLAKQITAGDEQTAIKQKYITPGKPIEWH
ncbi:hypothetical protein KPH14_011692 [Odynerus spinipes]|uniref:NADH dehydrogenase [ubiquinone] 1 alpha subcomplex subunit 7 n=1 Tax=Odynerus spinipes TaxID=1348599 RepID=A0AAD9RVI5_9HYME|nr:hypothetical protein KPH14_011692 [Odynerus spinipes]